MHGTHIHDCISLLSPGIVNQIQSNSIHGLGWIEFSNQTRSNIKLCVSLISEPIKLK